MATSHGLTGSQQLYNVPNKIWRCWDGSGNLENCMHLQEADNVGRPTLSHDWHHDWEPRTETFN